MALFLRSMSVGVFMTSARGSGLCFPIRSPRVERASKLHPVVLYAATVWRRPRTSARARQTNPGSRSSGSKSVMLSTPLPGRVETLSQFHFEPLCKIRTDGIGEDDAFRSHQKRPDGVPRIIPHNRRRPPTHCFERSQLLTRSLNKKCR